MTQQQPRSSQLSKRHPLSAQPPLSPTWHSATIVMLLTILGLSLSGCDIGSKLWDLIHTDGKAEAQIFSDQRQRVRTFIIQTDSFSIETENDADLTPIGTVTAGDSVTDYPITAPGTVRFNDSNGDPKTFDVDSGDRVIERPGAGGTGTLTIIDFSPGT